MEWGFTDFISLFILICHCSGKASKSFHGSDLSQKLFFPHGQSCLWVHGPRLNFLLWIELEFYRAYCFCGLSYQNNVNYSNFIIADAQSQPIHSIYKCLRTCCLVLLSTTILYHVMEALKNSIDFVFELLRFDLVREHTVKKEFP